MTETFHNPDIMSKEEEAAWDELEKRLTRQEKERERTAVVLRGSGREQKESKKTLK